MSATDPGAQGQTQIFRSTCPRDCYDACGMLVVKEKGKIVQVKGDPQHAVSRGKLCKKCSIGYNGIWLDPASRLTQPLRRTGPKGEGRFEPTSWDDAIKAISDRLRQIIETDGAETILNTHYTGTFAAIGYHVPMRFFNRLGATEVDPDTICNKAGHVALDYVYGSSLTGFDPRTAADSGCITVWGANPSATAPHAHDQWLQEAPGKIVVVDPIRTPTASIADLHLQPHPGTDAALAFAIMHVLRRDGFVDEPFIERHTVGWAQLEQKLGQCNPEWGAKLTGVAAQDIERAARLYGEGPSLLWLGQGFQRQHHGGNAMRACAMLPAITGNIGKPGAGFLYLNGPGQRGIDDTYLLGTHLRQAEPRSISHMDLVEWLEDSARSKALFCWNINNAASNPQQSRLRKVLTREDLFMVVADVFATDTTDYADFVLPAASFLESDDLFTSYFDMTLSAQVKVSEPMGDSLPNSEIFRRLAQGMGYEEKDLYESDREIIETLISQSGIDETYTTLREKGTVYISPEPVLQFQDLVFPTPSGRIEIASAQAEADGYPLVPEPHADKWPGGNRLRLLSPASSWTLNDTFANDEKIEKNLGPAQVLLHPDDALKLGLNEGDRVMLVNETGKLAVILQLSTIVPLGVALSYKGRWPKRQDCLANVNILNPGEKSDMGESTSVHATVVDIVAI